MLLSAIPRKPSVIIDEAGHELASGGKSIHRGNHRSGSGAVTNTYGSAWPVRLQPLISPSCAFSLSFSLLGRLHALRLTAKYRALAPTAGENIMEMQERLTVTAGAHELVEHGSHLVVGRHPGPPGLAVGATILLCCWELAAGGLCTGRVPSAEYTFVRRSSERWEKGRCSACARAQVGFKAGREVSWLAGGWIMQGGGVRWCADCRLHCSTFCSFSQQPAVGQGAERVVCM